MTKTIGITAALVAAFAVGAAAQAAGGWRVFATGTDSSDYGAYVSANADVLHPQALAMRMTKPGKITWTLSCQSGDKPVAANQVIEVTVAAAKSCSLYGSGNTDQAGTLRVQLLRR